MTQEIMSLAVFDPIRATLVELEKKDKSLVFDHTSPEAEKEKSHKAEVERLAQVEAEKAEQARLAEVEHKRVENVNHRQKIEKRIVDFLKSITGNEELSKIVVKHLVAGNIPNVTINY